jgi:hypothetical protein
MATELSIPTFFYVIMLNYVVSLIVPIHNLALIVFMDLWSLLELTLMHLLSLSVESQLCVLDLIIRGSSVQISARILAILTEVSQVFPHSLQENVRTGPD